MLTLPALAAANDQSFATEAQLGQLAQSNLTFLA
jgi:hypothetical protein